MPIYEFKCTECPNTDEHLMRLSDPAPTACTACGKPVVKVMSNSSFALKGSGWYVTDYKNKGSSSESSTSS
jgi:putative FmdB family regulatory protein